MYLKVYSIIFFSLFKTQEIIRTLDFTPEKENFSNNLNHGVIWNDWCISKVPSGCHIKINKKATVQPGGLRNWNNPGESDDGILSQDGNCGNNKKWSYFGCFESGALRICWKIGCVIKGREEPRMKPKFSVTAKKRSATDWSGEDYESLGGEIRSSGLKHPSGDIKSAMRCMSLKARGEVPAGNVNLSVIRIWMAFKNTSMVCVTKECM